MNLLRALTGLFAVCMLFSCKKEEQPKVIYEPERKPLIPEVKKVDSTQIRIADLPVLMEGSSYLIHPVGDIRVYNVPSSKFGSSKVDRVSYAVSNYNRFELTGYFHNLMFQHKDSLPIRPLTDLKVQIQTVTYLPTIALKTKKDILIYSVFDEDTNRDGKVDSSDIKTLYISHANGLGFKKLSQHLHELLDWNVIEDQHRIYFRTIEDINKNGAFDKKDSVNYYYVDLLDSDWKPVEYSPFGLELKHENESEEEMDTEEE